jgi:hypothetical protein
MGEATEDEIFMLVLGGLHERHAVQRGIWILTQHLLYGPRKTTENFDRFGQIDVEARLMVFKDSVRTSKETIILLLYKAKLIHSVEENNRCLFYE